MVDDEGEWLMQGENNRKERRCPPCVSMKRNMSLEMEGKWKNNNECWG